MASSAAARSGRRWDAAQRLGHEVGDVAEAVEQGPDGPAEAARGDLLAGRVDGDDLVGEPLGVVALAQHLVAGVGHAEAARLPGELAREGGDRAHGQLLGVPGLVEPGADPGAAVVGHPDLEDAQVAPGHLLGQVADGPDQGDLGALLGVGQVGELAPGQVAARVVLDQVAGGVVAEAVLQRLGQRGGHPGSLGQRGAERVGRSGLGHRLSIGAGSDGAVLPSPGSLRIRANSHSRKVFRRWLPSVTSAASTRASA